MIRVSDRVRFAWATGDTVVRVALVVFLILAIALLVAMVVGLIYLWLAAPNVILIGSLVILGIIVAIVGAIGLATICMSGDEMNQIGMVSYDTMQKRRRRRL